MEALYATQSEEQAPADQADQPTAAKLSTRLHQQALQDLDFAQITLLLTDMAIPVRNQSIDTFAELPAALQAHSDPTSELLRRGLEILLEQTDAGQLQKTLETQMETRINGLEKAHLMIIEGIMLTQIGKDPKDIAESVHNIAD